jgi:hypothetical protein
MPYIFNPIDLSLLVYSTSAPNIKNVFNDNYILTKTIASGSFIFLTRYEWFWLI